MFIEASVMPANALRTVPPRVKGRSPPKSVRRIRIMRPHIAALSRRRPGVTPHILRHTAAAWMAMAGVPMAVIARLLGHTD